MKKPYFAGVFISERKYKRSAFFNFFLCIVSISSVWAQAPTKPQGTYTTSWIGNTFMDFNTKSVVTESGGSICVSPKGVLFSAGYAEAWGGGAAYNIADGSFAGRYQNTNSGFGDPLSVVAADSNYVYYGAGTGILRAAHGGQNGGYEVFLPEASIQGLFYKKGRLYVSDYKSNKIFVLNTATMAVELSWSCQKPTRLTVDNSNKVWVVINSNTSIQPPTDGPMWWGEKIISFSSTGVPGAEITDFEKPLTVALDNNGKLLVAGLNDHSQVWKYDVSNTPVKVGEFGAAGGIFSGVSGAFTGSPKLHWIKGIFVDAANNIYTACAYGTFWGNAIEKWSSAGVLQWRLFAGTSLDCAGIDPENETEVYSKYHHYSLDYSKKVPGKEWSLKGFTVNRFKYPNDPRVDQNTDVGSRSLGGGVYRIGGKLFVVRGNQEGYRWELFRQETTSDGEVLVPSVIVGSGGDANNHFYNPTTKTWIDKPKKDNLYNQAFAIAKSGDLFTVADDDNLIVRYPFGGFDAYNNPIWDASTATTSSVPGFTYDVRRIYYDSDEDVMYVTGDEPPGEWGTFLKIKRYNNWLAGNRTSSFTVTLPYNDPNYTPETSYGGGQPVSFTVAGDYMFVLYGYGHVRIIDKHNGGLVGTMVQDINGWKGGGGQVDAAYGLTAYKRSNGEYIIFFENAAWANIMMHRWIPGECITCQAPSVGITSPGENSTFYTPATVTINATASDPNGTVSSVEFYNGDTLLGTDTSSPYSFIWENVSPGAYTITVKATDNTGASTISSGIPITVGTLRNPENPAKAVNGLNYSYYTGSWDHLPDFKSLETTNSGVSTTGFDLTPRTQNDDFAFRFTGYIEIQKDGFYTFYTASDDGSKLYIGKKEIVNNDGLHGADEKSGIIALKAGKHSITVEFFEGSQGEELKVSYSSNDIQKTTIPASALYTVSCGPVAVKGITLSPIKLNLKIGSTTTLFATINPTNASNKDVIWSSNKPEVATVNASGVIKGIALGCAIITVTTVDGKNTATSEITVKPASTTECAATGNILYQRWDGIPGTTVSNLTTNPAFPNSPTFTGSLTSMETVTDMGDNYGTRIAGDICAPATGEYTFWIAGDDAVELWISTDDNPNNKAMVAYHTEWTNSREWDRFITQKSLAVSLVQGKSYYIEALMKEGEGGDNLAVGWALPGQPTTAPSEVIPGSVLSPFSPNLDSSPAITTASKNHLIVLVFPNPANNVMSIELPGQGQETLVSLIDLSGTPVYNARINTKTHLIITESLTTGLYILNVQMKNKVSSQTVLISHY